MDSKKTHTIETISFLSKLSDIYLFLDYASSAMSEPSVKQKALGKWMYRALNSLRDSKLVNREALPLEEFAAFQVRAEEAIEESFLEKFNHSNKTILNLSLVMMCTVMELFFEHIFTVVLKTNPKTLLGLSKDKNVTVEQFLNYSSYDEVLGEFISKSIDRIIRQGTKEILKAFDTIGIKTSQVFSWSNFAEDAQLQFADWNSGKLVEVFDERHSIVHDDAMPLESLEELLQRKEFFDMIIISMSVQTWRKFHNYGVILDIQEQMRGNVEAPGGNPTGSPPPPK